MGSSVEPQQPPLPAWIDLPAPRPADDFAALELVELIIGRLAMMGAAGLIGKELLTGESFAEQFVDFFGTVGGSV